MKNSWASMALASCSDSVPWRTLLLALVVLLTVVALPAFAHNVSESNANFLAGISGPAIPLFIYLGAKHMVTGIDHVLYLLGIVFFVYQPRQVMVFVTLFALGHSITLLGGVLFDWQVSPGLVDAVIGLSVAYKAFENISGFTLLFGRSPNVQTAVFAFGLVHGLGLATKLQAVYSGGDGLVANLLAFNVGVELGQVVALVALLLVLIQWRRSASFERWAYSANVIVMASGFTFAIHHFFSLSLAATG